MLLENIIEVINPFTKEKVGEILCHKNKDVGVIVQRAQSYGFSLSARQRNKILIQAAQKCEQIKDELALSIMKEIGTVRKNAYIEVNRSIQVLKLSAEEALALDAGVLPPKAKAPLNGPEYIILREPMGIVLCITPFNFPLNQVAHKVAPALAANNAVIVKPSEKCPLTAIKFCKVFHEAGIPEEMLQCVIGKPEEIGWPLIENEHIAMISFTGSTKTGEMISKRAGIKKLSFELGGNDAFVVMPDCDVDRAVRCAVNGSFGHAGQRCSSVKRIILCNKIAQAFIEKFRNETQKLIVGDPFSDRTDIGPVINEDAAKIVEERVNEAIKKGAEVVLQGKREGALLWPTILDRVPFDTGLIQKETFGPVAPIVRAESFEEAIQLVNRTSFGLNAAIMTKSYDQAIEFARRVNVGGVRINESTSFRDDYLPFGGNKQSGFGRSGVKCAVEEMTRIKTIIFSREN